MTHKSNLPGFTLIELLVVASLTVLIMLTVTSMFTTFLVASQKANLEQRLRAEGESALSKMEFTLLNSRRLVEGLDGATICLNEPTIPMTNIAVEGLDGFITTLQTYPEEEPKIASHSTAISDYYYLTSDETTLSNLEFICLNGAEGSYYVGISFDLTAGTGSAADRETSVESFQGGVTLRN